MDKKEEFREPEFWLKRRAIRAFIENVGPVLICVGTLIAYIALGYIELGR